jgi:hypothetical protein
MSVASDVPGWSYAAEGAVPLTVPPGGTTRVTVTACGVAADSTLTVANDGSASPLDVTLLRPGSGCAP